MTKTFTAAIDDSGDPRRLIDWGGNFIEAPLPFVGLAAVVIRDDLILELESRWAHLQTGIQKKLGTPYLPPIHLRLMWGKSLPNHLRQPKAPNPYLYANFAQIRAWLREARTILLSLAERPQGLTVYADFMERKAFAENMSHYYRDPKFAAEHEFLKRHKTNGQSGILFNKYHNIGSNPLLRQFIDILWRINTDLNEKANGAGVHIVVDRFSGAHSIDAQIVLSSAQTLSELSRIRQISHATAPPSPLSQAADLYAFSYNRMVLLHHGHIAPDPYFEEIARPLIDKGRTLGGWTLPEPYSIPQELDPGNLCIIYAAAYADLLKKDPVFVRKHLIDVAEFHRRAKHNRIERATGISILKDGALTTEPT